MPSCPFEAEVLSVQYAVSVAAQALLSSQYVLFFFSNFLVVVSPKRKFESEMFYFLFFYFFLQMSSINHEITYLSFQNAVFLSCIGIFLSGKWLHKQRQKN